MSNKQTYQQKLQAQLDEWDAKIDVLKAKAEKADADMKLQIDEQMANLRTKQNAARQRMAELQDASDDAWEDLKGGLESAWRTLGDAVQNATSRFK